MPEFLDKFLSLFSIAKDARRENAPREWLFVNAYGPEQTRLGEPLTYWEALDFLKEHIGCSFVRVDKENSIIFFDGRKLAGNSFRA